LYVQAGLEDTKEALLVMIGALSNGQKVVLAVESGQRESKAVIWKMLRVAESTFRRLKGAELLPAVYAGAQYVDGVQRTLHLRQQRAA
jgi:transposase-like protein